MKLCSFLIPISLIVMTCLARVWLGGDEFVTIIEGISNQKDCLVVAEERLRSLPVLLDERQKVSLQADIGLDIFPEDITELQGLIKYAEARMISAKHQDNQICFYQESSRV